jgi:hypothetical protein
MKRVSERGTAKFCRFQGTRFPDGSTWIWNGYEWMPVMLPSAESASRPDRQRQRGT